MKFDFTLANKNGTISFKINKDLDEGEIISIVSLCTTVLSENEEEEDEVELDEEQSFRENKFEFKSNELGEPARERSVGTYPYSNEYNKTNYYGYRSSEYQFANEDIPDELRNIPDGKQARLKIVHIDSVDRVSAMRILRQHGVGNLQELKECLNEQEPFPVMEAKQVAKIILDLKRISCYAQIKYVDDNKSPPMLPPKSEYSTLVSKPVEQRIDILNRSISS